jgi:hypothetical protein
MLPYGPLGIFPWDFGSSCVNCTTPRAFHKQWFLAPLALNSNRTRGGMFSSLRDEIAQGMTSEQIAEAQALARRCIESDYQDCG